MHSYVWLVPKYTDKPNLASTGRSFELSTLEQNVAQQYPYSAIRDQKVSRYLWRLRDANSSTGQRLNSPVTEVCLVTGENLVKAIQEGGFAGCTCDLNADMERKRPVYLFWRVRPDVPQARVFVRGLGDEPVDGLPEDKLARAPEDHIGPVNF